ncbi:TonB family protein [Phenylobacterium aquaticum]|uniref:TonB family protein n=1 Tax=Phenylobacterium aquaticum TaxID=1763816 RepID=UPI001F5CBC30|nr:TonB family protein [Phenylobacterium aquaticum]MCI3132445.1 energy transducer TonB [Phenylobacterium aquaticum]
MTRHLPRLALLSILVSAAGAAGAAPVNKPVWDALPSNEDVLAVYPAAAKANDLSGRAKITCTVTAAGRLDGCGVVSEEPAGAGFGAAALALAGKFSLEPHWADGRSAVGAALTLPFRFEPPELRAPELKFQRRASYGGLGDAGPYYPDDAARRHLTGLVVMDCDLAADGALSACVVRSETPEGYDFDAAALRMAGAKWMTAVPRLVDGQPLALERVRVTVKFGGTWIGK